MKKQKYCFYTIIQIYRSSYKTLIEFLDTLPRYTKLKMEAKLPALSYPSRLLPKNCQKS